MCIYKDYQTSLHLWLILPGSRKEGARESTAGARERTERVGSALGAQGHFWGDLHVDPLPVSVHRQPGFCRTRHRAASLASFTNPFRSPGPSVVAFLDLHLVGFQH